MTKNSNVSLDKSYENRRSNKIDKFIRNKKFYTFKNLSTSHKQVYEINNTKYLSRIKCFKCHKKNITKRSILINTNKTSLSLSLSLQSMRKKIKLRRRLANETKKTNKNNELDFSKRLNLTS
jgi:hypothetical protein